MLLQSAGILYVKDKKVDEYTVDCEIIRSQLESLFTVESVVGTEHTFSQDLLNLYNKHDVLIIIIDRKNCEKIFTLIASITDQKLVGFELFQDSIINLPEHARIKTDENNVPIVSYQRIFVLVEDFGQEILSNLLTKYLNSFRIANKYRKILTVQANGHRECLKSFLRNESMICTDILETADKALEITLESESFDEIFQVETELIRKLGCHSIVRSVEARNDKKLIYSDDSCHVQSAINDIKECFANYGPENVFLSFNGGKDCTVLLHLVNIVLRTEYPDFQDKLFCLYVKSDNPFPEQESFIEQCRVYYNLNIISITNNIKVGLEEMLAQNSNFQACFMGTRRTDPYSEDLQHFHMTDKNWPQIMRVNPLLDWHYSDIWDYLLYYNVPYCILYNQGYTSLGNVANTVRNPSLFVEENVYLPAYKLLNEKEERHGRIHNTS